MTELKVVNGPKAKIALEAHVIENGLVYFVSSSDGDEFGQRNDKHSAIALFNDVVSYIRANPEKGDYYANGKK